MWQGGQIIRGHHVKVLDGFPFLDAEAKSRFLKGNNDSYWQRGVRIWDHSLFISKGLSACHWGGVTGLS